MLTFLPGMAPGPPTVESRVAIGCAGSSANPVRARSAEAPWVLWIVPPFRSGVLAPTRMSLGSVPFTVQTNTSVRVPDPRT